MRFLLLLTCISLPSLAQIRLSGYVYEANSHESLPGVVVRVKGSLAAVLSNAYGFYSIVLPNAPSTVVSFSMLGYQPIEKTISAIEANKGLNVGLALAVQVLKEVQVQAEPLAPAQMSMIRLPLEQIKQIPTLLGEKDVIKALQLLPGVQKGVEGSTALYVRGGGADQNLMLLDEAPVYNANHLFGFFSVFNGDALKNVSFYKGGFPARYGGRVSSVIDIQMKDGNKQQTQVEGGIGLLSSQLTVELPLSRSKSSLLLSGRRSYIDLLTKPFMPSNAKEGYFFYDFSGKYSLDVNNKNKVFVSVYTGHDQLDVLQTAEKTLYSIKNNDQLGWGNATATARWNHLFSQKLFLNTTLIASDFKFGLSSDFQQTSATAPAIRTYASYTSSIRDYGIKADFDYSPNNTHAIKFGLAATRHAFLPRTNVWQNNAQDTLSTEKQVFNNLELATYAEDTYTASERLSANVGIRLSGLLATAKTFAFAEPRLSVSYRLGSNTFLKASYARSNQFVHLLSNTGVGLSTDLWVPTTASVPPQQADQVAIGVFKQLLASGLSVSVEGYRKNMHNIIAYKEGAAIVTFGTNNRQGSWQDNITIGRGWSYGTELLLQKDKGRLTGWVGYTLAWTIHQFDELNNGQRFYPRHDRRHDLGLALHYKLSPKVRLSANWVYATGNALTAPQGYYFGNSAFGNNSANIFQGNTLAYLGSRNSFRAESYHRLDIGIQFLKKKHWGERTWEVGLYNAYNRKNPYYYYLATDFFSQQVGLGKKSLFPIIPSVSYRFKF